MLKASKHEAIFKIRFPLRVVEDYDVDRLQVYNRNVEPSNTNCPKAFFVPYGITLQNEIFLFHLQLSLYRSIFKFSLGDLGVYWKSLRWL